MTLFLHGFMGDETDAPHGTIALKIPYHGECLERPSTWDGVVDFVAQQIADDAEVLAYSMGGRIALGIAARFPNKISRLNLIAANPGLSESEKLARLEVDELRAQNLEEQPETFLDDWKSFSLFGPQNSEQWSTYHHRVKRTKHWAAGLRVMSVAKQPDYRSVLEQTSTTFIVGEHDEKYRKIGEEFAQELVVVPNAWHAVHRDRPDFIRAHIG